MTSKIALKLAYIGTQYVGFQMQPGRLTVQGALIEALAKTGVIENKQHAHFSASGRTDKGVHALGMVISFNTEVPMLTIPRRINAELPSDIWTWAKAEVSSSFDPRRDARQREYQYLLWDQGYDVPAMRAASAVFLGVHDFANFTIEKERVTTREIASIGVRVLNGFVIIDVAADSFLWQMARKIVTSLALVGSGAKGTEWIEAVLNPKIHREGVPPAPAHGLILSNVTYGNVHFEEDAYAKKRAQKMLHNKLVYASVTMGVLNRFEIAMNDQLRTPDKLCLFPR